VDKGRIFTVFNPVAKTGDMIKRPATRTTFIYLGRVIYEGQKRIKDLLTALSKVTGEWTLEVYGDGPDKAKCQAFAEKLGITTKVCWKGYVSNPWGQIRQATALILSSAYEGMPMVLAEAIARGVYCVSSDCPTGPEDIIVDGVNGELFPTGNVQALQQKLQGIVNGRPLPDQSNMKRSIERLYTGQYYKKLTESLSEIVHTFQ
jgi:UDP-D-galactose:(glucosyl)LPS alpha-1,6-D-galactosyltransferase